MTHQQKKPASSTASAAPGLQNQAARGSAESGCTPVDELVARFQLETERAIAAVRDSMQGQVADLASKVARLEDEYTKMREAASRQAIALEDAVHHTRKGVEECNEAMKVAAKAATEARDAALVYEKLRESQPDF